MKLILVMLTIMLFRVSATESYAQSTRINLNISNSTVKEVLKNIESKSEFTFYYNDDAVNTNRRITLNANNKSISEILATVLPDCDFKIYNKNIIITKKTTEQAATSQQGKKVKGVVLDSFGPIVGANIIEKGTTNGVISDSEGSFSINVAPGATLIVSYIGYASQEIKVTDQASYTITLREDAEALEEVVVLGYGSQKKVSLTASVSTLKGENVKTAPVANISNNLSGRVSGIIAKQGSGEPGKDGSNIYIRGISSIGGTAPLVVVDGIPRDDFTQLDPNTIETFTVLKDAAAVAPYGVAGANGVILVTTKKGKKGKPSFSYNGYVGFQNPTTLPKWLDNYHYCLLRNEAAVNDGLPKPYSDDVLQKYKDGSEPDLYPNQYVWDYIVNDNALLTTHNVEVNGGTENISYYASLGYQYQQGMWETTSNNRYNFSMKLDAKITKTTQLELGVIGRIQRFSYPALDRDGTQRIFELAGYAHPGSDGAFVYSNGMYGAYVTAGVFGSGYYKYNTTSLYTQITLTQELPFIKGLKFKGVFAYDPSFIDDKTWKNPMHVASIDRTQDPYVIVDGIFGETKSSLTQWYTRNQQFTYQAGLYYNNSFGKHNLNVTGVFEVKDNDAMQFGVSRRNYDLSLDEINMGSSEPKDWGTAGSSSRAKQLGWVYRAAYDYAGKYLIEVSGRYDGSYFFAPGKRFGFFPAFSVGWRLSEESFFENAKNLDNLKVRASYGEVGALAGSPFQYLGSYNVVGNNYYIGGKSVQGVSERIEPNPEITWEKAKKIDVGFDLTLWNNLLDIQFDYFNERRSNMLVNPNVVVPIEYGIGLSQVNDGKMKNNGFELSISSQKKLTKDLNIGLSGNITYAKNKLIQVYETSATYENPNRRQTGRPLGTHFGYKSIGYFQQDDFESDGSLKSGIAKQLWGPVYPGDLRYADLNDDGQIDDNDQTVIGDPSVPAITYGFSTKIGYKQFDLDVLFQGVAKTSYYYYMDAAHPFFNGMSAFENHFDYWTPQNPNASNPRITSAPSVNNSVKSSHWMGNANYLRLKSATLSYTLPSFLIEKLGMSSLRCFVSGQNLLTWTKLKNFDPESTNYRGWDYPQQRVFSFGVNVVW